MSSPAARPIGGVSASQPVFPDEILEEIFVRLDVAADLARTSAACTTFRRVVSARQFRRRFRSLHPPPVLGFLEFNAPGAFHPAEPPHASAPAARALAQAADFTFSFLDTPGCWWVCDSRDGRVLLYRRLSMDATFSDLVVCDPLHRRYAQLPPIPDDYAHSCFYWRFFGMGSLFVLNTREMKFSVVDQLPSTNSLKANVIVEVGEDRLGIVMVGDGVIELYSKTLGNKNNSVETEEWQLEKMIPLPQMHMNCDWIWTIPSATEGYLLLKTIPESHIQRIDPESHYFTLDLKTLLVERLCVLNHCMNGAHLYASFPPLLSPPSI